MKKLFSRGAKVFAKGVAMISLAVIVVMLNIPRVFAQTCPSQVDIDYCNRMRSQSAIAGCLATIVNNCAVGPAAPSDSVSTANGTIVSGIQGPVAPSGSLSTPTGTVVPNPADPNALNVPFYGHSTVNSFTEGGRDTIQSFSVAVYKLIFWLAIPVAVVMIIIGGVMITFGGTSSEGASTGKDIIINALSALALLSLAGLFLYTILPWFYTTR